MNDRMSDMDALVEVAARAICADRNRSSSQKATWRAYREDARIALLAIGLPALLERVEAAEVAITYETFCTAYRSARAFKSDNTERADFRTALDASETP